MGLYLMYDDEPVEQKIADSVDKLWTAMKMNGFDGEVLSAVVTAATPEFTRYYLKGQ